MLAGASMVKTNEKEKASRRLYSVNDINKDAKLYIRVTGEEKEKLQEVAERKGVTVSRLIMDLVSFAYF